MDPFSANIQGVSNLINSDENKTSEKFLTDTGVDNVIDILDLQKTDEELLELETRWLNDYSPYEGKLQVRQERNKKYYKGLTDTDNNGVPSASNIIFEAQETFIPQALARNPEPVVWSDNTNEGKIASNDIKTVLQYHADVLALNRKLGVMLRHWSIYLVGVVKHGWDKKANDISLSVRNPKNFVFDPNGYIDEKGIYKGAYLGEKIKCTAEELIELFPKHKAFITIKTNGKLGTTCKRIEWWTDDYCFTTFAGQVLEKHKNEFFNYETEEEGLDDNDEIIKVKTQKLNHLAHPQMPYNFLSIFSLQEQPHDDTNLIEQNIKNQDRITDRDKLIDKNVRISNNSLVVNPNFGFTVEKARQAASAIEDGDPILGDPQGITRLPAPGLPNGLIDSQAIAKDTLKSSFGVQGLAAQRQTSDTTARGMILNQAHDATRIGGGIGASLEQLVDSIFNFQVQMYYVFYDETHYAAVMGNGRAVEYVALNMTNANRHFVVSVTPDSMKPKDEITEQNVAIELANSGWLDPINLFKRLNDPDPMNTAKMVTMWRVSPEMYMQTFFPENQPFMDSNNPANPPDMQGMLGTPESTLGAPPANASLSQVPINTQAMPK